MRARGVLCQSSPVITPKRGERILNLGCGDGMLTEVIATYGADVLGADLSEELLAAAAAKGLEVQRVDGYALPYWMRRPELVIADVARVLKPHGRFVSEFGGHGNVAAITTAMAVASLALRRWLRFVVERVR